MTRDPCPSAHDPLSHEQPLVEKLDGCRGYWDGERMRARSGRVIPIPDHWRAKLPAMHLDGEIFAGRGKWDIEAVVRNRWDSCVCYMVFDAPQVDAPWPKRLAAAKKKLRCNPQPCFRISGSMTSPTQPISFEPWGWAAVKASCSSIR